MDFPHESVPPEPTNLTSHSDFVQAIAKERFRLKLQKDGACTIAFLHASDKPFEFQTAANVAALFRSYDQIALVSPEKIGILLPDTSIENSRLAIDRIQKALFRRELHYELFELAKLPDGVSTKECETGQ